MINEVAKAGIQIPQGAEEVNMCIAIQEMKKDAADQATDNASVCEYLEALYYLEPAGIEDQNACSGGIKWTGQIKRFRR